MLEPELASFLESGVSILFGTRDDGRIPDCGRAFGARVESGGEELTIFLPEATSATSLANLRANGQLALCFTRIPDHHSIQVKGEVVACEKARPEERDWIERHRRALVEALAFAGIPPRISLRMNHWPAHAVRLRVRSVFVQTPGPGAGAPLIPTPRGA